MGARRESMPGARWLTLFVSRTLEQRDAALDALRGLAIVGMILVNGAPPTDVVYSPLVHAEWHGWTLADTVFPLFLFIVGVSIALSVKRPDEAGRAAMRGMHAKLFRRAGLLTIIGIVLVNFPYYELDKLKVTGILTQIAVCYLVVAALHLHTTWRVQLALVPAIWLVHWALLEFIDVPGHGAGILTPDGNASRYVDQWLLGEHSQSMQATALETSGVLTMFSAISGTLIGLLTGHWWRSRRDVQARISATFAVGFGLCLLGSVWNWVLPINKPIWTASYVALMTGLSMQLYAAAHWLLDVRGLKVWATPLRIAGVNALAFYVLAAAIQRVLVYVRVPGPDGSTVALRSYLNDTWVVPLQWHEFGSLLYAGTILAICFVCIWGLYRCRIFVKL